VLDGGGFVEPGFVHLRGDGVGGHELGGEFREHMLDGALTSYETFVSTKIYKHAKFFTTGSPGIWMFLNALVISRSVWDGLNEGVA
jgi:TRAP-type C4-dicarboxylate transport system substrate-binding protein